MRLIFFDIDGTLTRTQNGFLPFNEAIELTFGFPGDIRTVIPDGNTDPLIVKDIFTMAGVQIEVEPEGWELFILQLATSYREHVSRGATTVRPLPGATALLTQLDAATDLHSSVVTGNFEATAQVKLETAGLAQYLSRGAYASDSEIRSDLPAIAKKRWQDFSGNGIEASRCVIIGDTPRDLEAARANGMKCVLVGTGRYPVEELQYWRPEACLADLADTDEVMHILRNL